MPTMQETWVQSLGWEDSPGEGKGYPLQYSGLENSMDCSPPGSFFHGILQARVLEWVAISFSRDLPDPGIEPRSPAFQADALTSEPQQQRAFQAERTSRAGVKVSVYLKVKMLVTQSSLTLCDPMAYSPPGSFFHGILQARILEWVSTTLCIFVLFSFSYCSFKIFLFLNLLFFFLMLLF